MLIDLGQGVWVDPREVEAVCECNSPLGASVLLRSGEFLMINGPCALAAKAVADINVALKASA